MGVIGIVFSDRTGSMLDNENAGGTNPAGIFLPLDQSRLNLISRALPLE
jgi:hypothetical protein